MPNVTIDVNLNIKCAECRKPGATQSGICLGCMTEALHDKPMKSDAGKAVQRRIHNMRNINPR